MTWTYNPALTTDKDKVRFLVSDVDSAKPLLQDEEILGILEMEGAARRAAATCAESLAAHFGQLATTLVDDLGVTVTYSDRAAFYTGLRPNFAAAPTSPSRPRRAASRSAVSKCRQTTPTAYDRPSGASCMTRQAHSR
jgi:hypothetical protein